MFDVNHSYKATLGITGQCQEDFGYLCHPRSVLVDGQGRIYVAEGWQTRVQVFDAKYRYLTIIGGEWGISNGGFREIGGLALDKAGSLYVVDSANHRVQKFARVVFGWQQSNIDGFGELNNRYITALKPLNHSLVAGTFNMHSGAQLWKFENDAWTSLIKNGFGHQYNLGITQLIDFKGHNYAGTSTDGTEGGEIWRSCNLTAWSRVVKDGFGFPDNAEINSLEVYKDMLYAGTWNWTGTQGGEIWRTASGNSGDWTKVVSNGFGNSENAAAFVLVTYKDMLYASTVNSATEGEVWHFGNGNSWIKVNSGGFGDKYNRRIFLVPDTDSLYAGTWNYKYSDNPGGELWRCSLCDGTDWKEVPGTKGFGDTSNYFPTGIALYDNKLFVGTQNEANGAEVWFRKGFYYLPSILKQ